MRKPLVAKRIAYYGKEYQDHDLFFCLDDGRPVESNLCEKWFTKFQKRCEGEYPKIKFHEIRHSIATLLVILSCGNPSSVQKMTGHHTPEILMRIYNHATRNMVNELSQRFQSVFYTQDVKYKSEVQNISDLSQNQLTQLVRQFENTLEEQPIDLKTKLPTLAVNLEQAIDDALEKDPTLRERLIQKLSMPSMQLLQQ